MNEFHIEVLGIPKGQGRPRRGKYVPVYSPTNPWKDDVIRFAKDQLPLVPITGPVKIEIIYRMPRPKNKMRKKDSDGLIYHTVKPDTDNLNKATYDALTNIGFFQDDKILVDTHAQKFYHEKQGRPGASIRITQLEEVPA